MNIFYNAINLKCEGHEKQGFILDRPNGTDDYLFLHFKTPVNILQNDNIINVTQGTCLITTPRRHHWFESPDCELEHDWVHFIPDNADEFLNLGLPVNKIFMPLRTNFITSLVKDCQEEIINKEMYWEENISSSLSKLFVLLARETQRDNAFLPSKYMRDKFKKFRLMLYGNTNKNWEIDDMAKELSLSRSRFTVLYKMFFGVSPKEDLIEARISYAKYLLNGSSMIIDEVAQISGYSNVYHFIRQFKDVTGSPPGNIETCNRVA